MPLAMIAMNLGNLSPILGVLIIAVAVWGIIRGLDVRVVLLTAAFAMASLAGDIRPIVREFLATFSNEKFVVPICSAMGFAYVLKFTECDQHLVRMLTRPLQKLRFFMIPGVVLVGFLVNIPVISQTSTAVCLGAVVVPLMRAANLTPVTIGASIVLGASIGGELLNPGAPELLTIATGLKLSGGSKEVVENIAWLVFPHLIIATAIFWAMSWWHERAATKEAPNPPQDASMSVDGSFNPLLAMVPLIPLVLLFLTGPPLNLLKVPTDWIVDAKSESAYSTRLIGAAMMVGVLVAAMVRPRKIAGIPRAFFDGAGYAFAVIVSIIVTANCFGVAIKQIGIAEWLGHAVRAMPGLLLPLAAIVPLLFAFISGSGMAATQSLFGLFVGPDCPVNVDPQTADANTIQQGKEVGAVISAASATGRTMSPVAAVCLMSATLTNTNSFALAKRVAIPLLVSWGCVVLLRMLHLV